MVVCLCDRAQAPTAIKRFSSPYQATDTPRWRTPRPRSASYVSPSIASLLCVVNVGKRRGRDRTKGGRSHEGPVSTRRRWRRGRHLDHCASRNWRDSRNQECRLRSSWLGWGDDSVMWHRGPLRGACRRSIIGGIPHGEIFSSSVSQRHLCRDLVGTFARGAGLPTAHVPKLSQGFCSLIFSPAKEKA